MRKFKLCKTDLYNSIKEIPDTHEFRKEYEENHCFYLTEEEYYLKDSLYHQDCMRLPNGLPRFGTIGGGFSVKFYLHPSGEIEKIAKCQACGEELNLTKKSKELHLDDKTYEEYHKKALKSYSKLTELEYARYKKFLEDHSGNTIIIDFIGTGLGWIVTLKDETTGEYTSITDINNW